jgi:membrane protease YdiL (CAAX protease family)
MKRNWIYIVLVCFIILVNIFSRFIGEEPPDQAKIESPASAENLSRPDLDTSLFVDFEEARRRSEKIEDILKDNRPLSLLYASLNLFIVLIFFMGLLMGGYFIFSLFKKKDIFLKIRGVNPPGWKIGDLFKIIILAVTFSYIFFMIISFFRGFLEAATGASFAFLDNENFRMIFDTIILDSVVLFVIIWFLRKVHRRKLASLGLVRENLTRNIFYGACGYIAVMPVVFIIGILVYVLLNIFKLTPPPQPIVELFLMEKNTALVFGSSIIAAFFGPVIEEIFFRGVMYNAVKRKLGVFRGILITSVLFSFLHTHAFSYFLVGFIPIAILGAALAYLYEKTGSLIPSITLHILNNVGSVAMVFLFKYFNSLAA